MQFVVFGFFANFSEENFSNNRLHSDSTVTITTTKLMSFNQFYQYNSFSLSKTKTRIIKSLISKKREREKNNNNNKITIII